MERQLAPLKCVQISQEPVRINKGFTRDDEEETLPILLFGQLPQ